ncbi:MAG: hypothetical protein NUV80_06775 [Candidatus Berkelbacteria bacterium]|nr:hypothetical protein [Candidatus Berkelbacteria bacterium]
MQRPVILNITGSTLKIAHPDITEYTRTRVATPYVAAATALVVIDNKGFADNDYLLLGEVGDPKSEDVDVNGTVTRGTSITLTTTITKFGHEIDAPVTRLLERGIKIYGAATDGGAGTLIASVDAITASGSQLADAVMIQWNQAHTEYTLLNTDTAYSFYYVTFTDGTTESPSSDFIASTGPAYNSGYSIVNAALREADAEIDNNFLTWELMLDYLNDWQDEVTHYVTADGISKDWAFEIIEDSSSLTAVQNTEKYALSSLTNEIKYPDSHQGILSVKLGSKHLWEMTYDDYVDIYNGIKRTEVATAATAGDTSIVLDDTYEFAESGTVYIGPDTVTYTTNTESTGTLSGIPASGTGSITATRAINTVVWQGVSPNTPSRYTIFNGYLYTDAPCDNSVANYKFKINYLYKLARLTALSEATVITFSHIAKYYIAGKIESRKGNVDNAERLLAKHRSMLEMEARKDRLQIMDQTQYYNFTTHSTRDGLGSRRYRLD